MKKYLLLILIGLALLVIFQLLNFLANYQDDQDALDQLFYGKAKAESLRDFRDTQELETWLEQVYQNKPPLVLVLDSSGVARFYDICVPFAEALINRANEQGYKVERYRITSSDYYRYWYNEDPYWQPNEGHGVALVMVNGRTFLIEPTIPMSWELTVPYAGQKVGVAWE